MSRAAARRLGLLLAGVALFLQLSLGAAVIDEQAMHQRMAAAGICHPGPAGPDHPPLLPHGSCPFCLHALALHVAPVLPGSAAGMPAPATAVRSFLIAAGGPRAPPGAGFVSAYPRGPPLS